MSENATSTGTNGARVDGTKLRGILGRKLQMTQVFTEDGRMQPVTLIEAGPCTVLQVRSVEADGYQALQLGFGGRRSAKVRKPQMGHFKKAGLESLLPEFVKELEIAPDAAFATGQVVDCTMFAAGTPIHVIGTSKGKGFAGVIKRFHHHRKPETHGCKSVREPGSNGMATTPGRVLRGKTRPGHMGTDQVTLKNLKVISVHPERNLLVVSGAVPGPAGGFVIVNKVAFGK